VTPLYSSFQRTVSYRRRRRSCVSFALERAIIQFAHLGAKFAVVGIVEAFELAHLKVISIERLRVLSGMTKCG
jgi:hypothetical protein